MVRVAASQVMAPQTMGYGTAADIWSVGITLVELATGCVLVLVHVIAQYRSAWSSAMKMAAVWLEALSGQGHTVACQVI